jgi:pimeloyl-ACP methyl ester carboxylesterase
MIVLIQENQVYYDSGEQQICPELPTLVFIHGAQNDHSVWRLQSQYFAHHGYNVLAVDLPGHGLSKGRAKATIEAMAQWLIAFFDVVGVNKAGLIGHSMGSLIALETARTAPLRVTKLALLGNAYPMKVAESLLTSARENEAAAIDMVTKWSHYNTEINLQENTKQLMQRMSEINPDHLLYTDLSACNNYVQGEQAAAVINHHHCPTLFVMAEQDRMTPGKASAQLRTVISEACVIEIAECGHAMLSEQPDAVLAALVDFLK